MQLLATNSKDNLEKKLRELVEYEMYDHSTVSKIAAVLDITNALTDEEKSLLFKASLFLNEYFSGFESYCYEIDKSQVEINTTLYNLYLEKKILKIKSIDSDKITEYKIHESIIKYLNQWH
ncbi:MAG: hypothetical protein IPO26_18840 [Saprospiraceae bacterium]|nr:hypothetical protein [Saprospiraceae bacterium]